MMCLTLYALTLRLPRVKALSGYAQATKLNLKMEKTHLVREVLPEIEKHFGIPVSLQQQMVDVDRKVSVNFREQTIDKALNKLFKNTGAAYRIIDRQACFMPKASLCLKPLNCNSSSEQYPEK